MSSPSNRTVIERLTLVHAKAFMGLRLQALQTDPDAYLSTYESESQKLEPDFARELEYARGLGYLGYYGSWHESELTGYCQIAKSFLAKQDHVLFIHNLYVKPNYRHQGIAGALMQHMFALARVSGIEIIYLSCNDRNKPALSFYKKCGFVECGRKPKSLKWNGQFDDEIELVLDMSVPTPA